MAHPGFPTLPTATEVSDGRERISEATLKVKTSTLAVTTSPIDPTVHGNRVLCDASSGAIILSLPDPTADADAVDLELCFIKTDATINTVTVDTVGTPTINGAASLVISTQWAGLIAWNEGTAWYARTF